MSQKEASWDLEAIMTKAIYRVLNKDSEAPTTLSVERTQMPLPSSDVQLQLRLLAEQLCKRIERRYEKRLQEQRNKDRVETEKKLANIRNEYHQEVEMKTQELDRERQRVEENMRDHERIIRHRIELKLSEKENTLEVTRKMLETRLTELTLNKENLDRAKAEFQSKMTANLELINLEWERLAARESDIKSVQMEKYEIDRQQNARRIAELEDENKEFQKKLAQLGSENCELRARLVQLDGVQVDLDVTKERIKKEVEENKRLYNQLKLMSDYDYLVHQNAKLSDELNKLKTECSRSRAAEIQERGIERRIVEESHLLKIKELKMITIMMNNKIKSLSSERDFLRDEVRALRREMFKDITRGRKQGLTLKIPSKETVPRRSGVESTLHTLSDIDTSEETSVTSSTFSDRNMDIRKIKERIRNLDVIARDLDATVEHFAPFRSNNHEKNAPKSQEVRAYEEFCQGWSHDDNRNNNSYKSSYPSNMPEKRALLRIGRESPLTSYAQDINIEDFKALDSHEVQLDKPTPKGATLVTLKQPLELVTSKQEGTTLHTESLRTATKESARKADFFKRLDSRDIFEKGMGSSELRIKNEGVMNSNTYREDVENKQLPDVDPIMEQYMALVTQKKTNQNQDSPSLINPMTELHSPSKLSNVLEIMDDDLKIDKPENSDGEIEW